MKRDLSGARFLPLTIGMITVLLGAKLFSITEIALAGEPGAVVASRPALSERSSTEPSSAKYVDRATRVPGLAHAAPAISIPAPARLEPDPSLAEDLQHERADLERQQTELDAREAAAKASSDALDRRMAALEALNRKINDARSARQTGDEAAWKGLVKVYEAMRPEDAATIFNGLEIHTLLQLLDRMNDRKAALVLGAMQPERARVVTQMLAQQRLEDVDQSASRSSG